MEYGKYCNLFPHFFGCEIAANTRTIFLNIAGKERAITSSSLPVATVYRTFIV